MSSVLSCVLPRAQVTRPQGIPFETRLVFALGYKLLVLVSHIELKSEPQFADTC